MKLLFNFDFDFHFFSTFRKNKFVKKISFYLFVVLCLVGCNDSDKDAKGRILLKALTTSSGSKSLSPMMVSDSASRLAYVPDTFFYKSQLYTGEVVVYEYDTIPVIVGNIKGGLMDSTWTFYFVSGGVKMKGEMRNGVAIGVWQSFYGYDKVSVEKVFDNEGFLTQRKEFFDNGKLKNIQIVPSPVNGKGRNISYDKNGNITSLFVQDSIKL